MVCGELGCWNLLKNLLQPVVLDDLDCLEVAKDLLEVEIDWDQLQVQVELLLEVGNRTDLVLCCWVQMVGFVKEALCDWVDWGLEEEHEQIDPSYL